MITIQATSLMYILYVAGVIVGTIYLFKTKGKAGVRSMIVAYTEWTLYLFMLAMLIAGGIVGSFFGITTMNQSMVLIGLLVGSAVGLALSLPIVAMVFLQIDIARNTREALPKQEDNTARFEARR